MKVARDYNLTIEDQFQVQYFTAGGQIVLDDLVLMKEKNVTSEGVIELKKTPAVQQVRIQNNTPGVMDSIHLDAKNVPLILFVRVEQDGVNRFLPFVHAANDYYYFALNAPIKNGKLQIKYDNITYSASPSCRNVYLAVKINEQSNPATITRDAQGVRINQGDSLH